MKKTKPVFQFIIIILLIFIGILLVYFVDKSLKNNKKNIPLKEIIEVKESNFKVWFYGIDSLKVNLENEDNVDLEQTLKNNPIFIEKLKEYLEHQAQQGKITKDIMYDGGTRIYSTQNYKAIFCNTLEGNKDIYFTKENIINSLSSICE